MWLSTDGIRHSGQNDPRRLWQDLKTLPCTWIYFPSRQPRAASRDIRDARRYTVC
jgi:hypothetical protein